MGRCFGDGDALYEHYHDTEWGRPVTGERAVFERLCLEGFQAGLSWLTILRRREAFRDAFAGFAPAVVAVFTAADRRRLLADERIVRHAGKIDAVIANAGVALALRERGTPVERLLWDSRPAHEPPPAASAAAVPSRTAESVALARTLRAAGWRFIGPTTAYAAMQACGVVNDHIAGCDVRDEVESGRARVHGREVAQRW